MIIIMAKHYISTILFSLLGICLASLGIEGFLLPNHFIDGGVTGLSMLVSELTHQPLPLIILFINIPFVILGFRIFSWQFTLKSIVTITGLAAALFLFDFPIVTHDKLLAAIFGGVFLGSGIGFTIRGGTVLDGTEILALMLNKKIQLLIGDSILIFNTLLFTISAYFLGLEIAMYSTLTYISASRTIDFLVYGLDEHISLMVVTEKSNIVKDFIIHEFKKGVTILKGEGGYSQKNQNILFCVIPRFDIGKFKNALCELDPNIFIISHKIGSSTGGMVKKAKLP